MSSQAPTFAVVVFALMCASPAAHAQSNSGAPAPGSASTSSSTPDTPHFDTTVVVSADRNAERRAEAPTSVVAISGDRLEQLGVRTLSDALTLLPGLEVSAAGDEGPDSSGVALWGLREFDAYALVVDGVPAGGAYNPNPALVPVEDIDRIEVQKGPNAVLYGQTAFAGIVQVFTKMPTAGSRVHANASTGSLGTFGGSVAVDQVHDQSLLRLAASAHRASGWQQRAGEREERLLVNWAKPVAGRGQLRLIGQFVDRDYGFGAPLPRSGGAVAPGIPLDANYAVGDAAIRDRIGALSFFYSRPVANQMALVTTSSFTADSQARIRGFLDDTLPIAHASGSALSPTQLDVFEDAHLEWRHASGNGPGLLQAGVSYQFGRLEAESRLFDYTVSLANPDPPVSTDLRAEQAGFLNVRNFIGVYAHEQLAVSNRLTLAAGLRLDVDREHERIGGDRPDEAVVLDDAAGHTALSSRAAATWRLTSSPSRYVNLFGSFNRAFKPAAVNFAEPEAAGPILAPETANEFEGGVKIGLAGGKVDVQASAFDMRFRNLVVSQVRNGLPVYENAGAERFRGAETNASFAPSRRLPIHISAGYAFHRPVFTDYTMTTDTGETVVIDGRTLELSPKHLFSGQVEYGAKTGMGAYLAWHAAGSRPVNRRNTADAPGYQVFDAGVSYAIGRYEVVGSLFNLTDSRHIVAESELADAQVYLNPPRRGSVELRVRF